MTKPLTLKQPPYLTLFSFIVKIVTMIPRKYSNRFLGGIALRCIAIHVFSISLLVAAPSPILIGVSTSLSGPDAAIGQALYTGAQRYFSKVNDMGGINGRKIDLRVLDDSGDPLETVRNTIGFYNKNVSLYFGFTGTPSTTSYLPLLKLYNKLLVFPYSGSDMLRTDPYKAHVLNLKPSFAQETQALIHYFIQQGLSNISFFYQNDAIGHDSWQSAYALLSDQQLDLASTASFPMDDAFPASFASFIDIIEEGHPQAIVLFAPVKACTEFIKELRLRGNQVPVAIVSISDAEAILKSLETDPHSIPQLLHNIYQVHFLPELSQKEIPIVKEFLTNWRPTKYTNRPTKAELEGYINAMYLTSLLTQTKGDTDPLTSTFLKSKNTDLGLNQQVFPLESSMQALHHVYISKYDNGQFIPQEFY